MNQATEEVYAELVTPSPASQGEPSADPDAGDSPGELAPRYPWPPIPDGGPRFRPAGIGELAPSGARARIQANLEALEAAAGIVIDGAPLTAEAQQKMGRYGGWGAADAVFAPGASGNDLRDRDRLRAVLTRLGGSEEAGERLFRSAGLTVLNAHYTDPMLVGAIYQALAKLGLDQGTVVEPGAGSGQFAAFAPAGIRITGVELDHGNGPDRPATAPGRRDPHRLGLRPAFRPCPRPVRRPRPRPARHRGRLRGQRPLQRREVAGRGAQPRHQVLPARPRDQVGRHPGSARGPVRLHHQPVHRRHGQPPLPAHPGRRTRPDRHGPPAVSRAQADGRDSAWSPISSSAGGSPTASAR